ncbi:conserved hypothetical protein [Cupriavidus taiwanensis]|nr:hypothetical protein [Cupriavidus oxalaticus]SOY44473.1 conserved hypothetical protein [Cupriavidus taiwanensis]
MPALTLADSLRLAIDVSRDVAAFRGQDADRANALLAMYGEPPAHL